jgi:ABC-type antimicrobial peptide transport system permease subunit
MAFGAGPRQVLTLVISEGMKVVGVGLAVGLLSSIAFGRLIESQLYGIKATNSCTLAGVAVLLTIVALLACYVPARRAAKTDPVIALRHD